MKLLLLDIGNTRMKSAVMCDGVLAGENAMPIAVSAKLLRTALQEVGHRPDAVAVCNVAGVEIATMITAEVLSAFGCRPWFASATERACGVRNGYDDPSQLGVDRWAAIVGAYALAERSKDANGPICVVDAGSALTVDIVLADGVHQGGLIAPGIKLAAHALSSNTKGIAATDGAVKFKGTGLLALGTDTQSAVANGATLALAALIDRLVTEIETELSVPARILITGGDAERLQPWLQSDSEIRTTLVFEGLAALYAGQGQ